MASEHNRTLMQVIDWCEDQRDQIDSSRRLCVEESDTMYSTGMIAGLVGVINHCTGLLAAGNKKTVRKGRKHDGD